MTTGFPHLIPIVTFFQSLKHGPLHNSPFGSILQVAEHLLLYSSRGRHIHRIWSDTGMLTSKVRP